MPAPCRRPLVPPLSLTPHGKAGVQSWNSLASMMSPLPFPAWLDGILGLLLVTVFLQDRPKRGRVCTRWLPSLF